MLLLQKLKLLCFIFQRRVMTHLRPYQILRARLYWWWFICSSWLLEYPVLHTLRCARVQLTRYVILFQMCNNRRIRSTSIMGGTSCHSILSVVTEFKNLNCSCTAKSYDCRNQLNANTFHDCRNISHLLAVFTKALLISRLMNMTHSGNISKEKTRLEKHSR